MNGHLVSISQAPSQLQPPSLEVPTILIYGIFCYFLFILLLLKYVCLNKTVKFCFLKKILYKWNHTYAIFCMALFFFFLVQYYIPKTHPCFVELQFIHFHCCTLFHFKTIMKIFNVLKNLCTFGLFPIFGFYGQCS